MSTLAIIGGTGLYHIGNLDKIESVSISTPFGDPSDPIIRGEIDNIKLLFLSRHGRGHIYAPHRVNYRANIYALKQLGAEQIISVSAVGSLQETIHPGDIVLVDQYIDRTRGRPATFFDDYGIVAHVGFADPTDYALGEALFRAATKIGAKVHKGGVYVCIEGPQFSSRAESNLYRSWRADVIGMTNLPEAKLAREAELPYASIATVTDYDCWHEHEKDVSVEAVIEILKKNVTTVGNLLRAVLAILPDPKQSPASSALKCAIVTSPESISPKTLEMLELLIGKYLAR
ncbi:MAG: S-methyl-5'-thioadenosine phosphorylase [Deltaproteobacteria bacterium]|nr:S-methyl-5'-thioadenosine phosphorylase [Deltaproteobacteria bacterium]